MAQSTKTRKSLVASNFDRLQSEFGSNPAAGGSQVGYGQATGTQVWSGSSTPSTQGGFGPPPSGGSAFGAPPGVPWGPSYADAKPFVAGDVFNKVGILVVLAIASGVFAVATHVSGGVLVVAFIVAFGLAVAGCFRPKAAKVFAPLFAIFEGLVLGWVSSLYNSQSHGIVPLAVVFTGVVFASTLGAYRSGLVRVTNKFMATTAVLTLGLAATFMVAMFGVHISGINAGGNTEFLIVGVIYLVIAVMNLFVDFEFVNRAQQSGASAEGEWYAAFTIMLSLVMVYLAMLRILGASSGGSRR